MTVTSKRASASTSKRNQGKQEPNQKEQESQVSTQKPDSVVLQSKIGERIVPWNPGH